MAQVGRDRAQQVALALGQDEVVPAVAGARAAPRARRAATTTRGARRGRGRPASGASRPRVRAAIRLTSRRRADLLDREPELGGDVGRVVGAAEALPRRAALGERRQRHLDEQHACGRSAPAPRARVRPISTERSGRSSIARSSRARSAGSRSLEAVEAEQPRPRARRRASRRRARSALLEVAHVEQHQRPRRRRRPRSPRRPARTRPAAGACRTASERAHLGDGRRRGPATAGCGVDAAQRDRRAGARRAGRAAPSRNAASRSATLTGRSASGIGPSGGEQPDRAAGAQPARRGRSSRARRARSTPSPASRLGRRGAGWRAGG